MIQTLTSKIMSILPVFDNHGFLLSAVCLIQSIPIFSETGKFSLGLPNPLNVTIQFSFLLQMYLIALFLGKIFNCISHCWKWKGSFLWLSIFFLRKINCRVSAILTMWTCSRLSTILIAHLYTCQRERNTAAISTGLPLRRSAY